MGKGIGVLSNGTFVYEILAPSGSAANGVLDISTLATQTFISTFLDDQANANKTMTYTDGAITQMTLNVSSTDKYVIDFTYDSSGSITSKTITRDDDTTITYTYGYTDGVITSITVT